MERARDHRQATMNTCQGRHILEMIEGVKRGRDHTHMVFQGERLGVALLKGGLTGVDEVLVPGCSLGRGRAYVASDRDR